MLKLYLWVRNWLEGEEGQDLAEYALILALIAVAAIASLVILGGQINGVLESVGGSLKNAL